MATALLAAQPVGICSRPARYPLESKSIVFENETFVRLKKNQLRTLTVGRWLNDPDRLHGEPYRFRDVMRFDRDGTFEKFDDRGSLNGRYRITRNGIRLTGGFREHPELLAIFKSRDGDVLAGIEEDGECILVERKVVEH